MSAPGSIEGVAIVGMSGRFPGADDIASFWNNLCSGVESVSFFGKEEMELSPLDPPGSLDDPNYIRAKAVVNRAEWFDAQFFGMSPREAEILDPQQRIFLECALEALEDAGCDPGRFDGAIGVFAGSYMNTYLMSNILANRNALEAVGALQVSLGNDKDYLTTRVSYKLNLTGPSVSVQTACSTSLVAVALACQSLLTYQCDAALAGGVSIQFPQRSGKMHHQGGIFSPDGHCRAFDAGATGTVAGEGCAVVALKRMEDAQRDGDHVYAVIRGFATNNDGSLKAGFTAPSVSGQASVIAAAQAMASFDPVTIGYVETHGTGTPLGDPIEFKALREAFGPALPETPYCAIGSVKTNVGHMGQAAGAGSLIKAALAVERGLIPPSLHFTRPNPNIDFDASPFYVADRAVHWRTEDPRRAGISSFGIGGTNAHVVIEQAPLPLPARSSGPWLMALSAQTEPSLSAFAEKLRVHLGPQADADMDAVESTLALGRMAHRFRMAIVARDHDDLLRQLDQVSTVRSAVRPRVGFLFSGQGSQYVGMCRDLYASDNVVRQTLDRADTIFREVTGRSLLKLVWGEEPGLSQTGHTQPALFAVEWALVELIASWGVHPDMVAGHSLGEFAAAAAAGLADFESAFRLVIERGRLMQSLEAGGGMAAIQAPESDVLAAISAAGSEHTVSIAAVNGPQSVTISGDATEVRRIVERLSATGTPVELLDVSHAFHSYRMDPILEPWRSLVSRIDWGSGNAVEFVSTASDGLPPTSADYWVHQLRRPVLFERAVRQMAARDIDVWIEIGPRPALVSMARRFTGGGTWVAPLREGRSDREQLLRGAGALWCAGVDIHWTSVLGKPRRILSLPTYAFERQRYWIEPGRMRFEAGSAADQLATVPDPVPNPRGDVSPVEDELQQMWHSVLGRPVSRNDDFIDAGGHSLMATQLLARIRQRFGVDIPLRQFLEQPTVAVVAGLIARHKGSGADSDLGQIPIARPSLDVSELSESDVDRLLRQFSGKEPSDGP